MEVRTEVTQWGWPKPELTRAGQVTFWNRQSASYDTADMTTDNPHEIEAVISEISGESCRELVSLGGAVGCRDPRMILEQIFCSRKGEGCAVGDQMPSVIFNDLAPQLVERAKGEILAPCLTCGVQIKFFTGPIHEVGQSIGPGEGKRSFLLGVYSAAGFFNADEAMGYVRSGFDEYMKNQDLLGDRFWFDWLIYRDGRLEVRPSGLGIAADASETERGVVKKQLYEQFVTMSQSYGLAIEPFDLVAIQVVSAHQGQDGFFVSHWYNPEALLGMLREVFPQREFDIRWRSFPKGILCVIEPRVTQATGVITMLNNVLGNVLPDEQIPTLGSVRSLL